MFSPYKNSYLQCRSSGIKPRLLNRAVSLARNNPLLQQGDDSFHVDVGPAFLRLASGQPFHPVCHADITRRPLAFGVAPQVKKLIRELHSKDESVVLAALTSLCDILHDPEKGYTALKLRIVDRLADLLLISSETVRERTCCVLNVVASAVGGKELIMSNFPLVFSIHSLFEDVDRIVRMKAALLVSTISTFWVTADVLLETGFIPTILYCISKQDRYIIPFLLDALNSIMYCQKGKEIAYQYNAFPILLKLLSTISDDTILAKALEGIASILHLPECKKRALDDDVDLLAILDSLLRHENPDVYNATAHAVMFATIKMRAKIEIERFLYMPKRLIQLAGNCLSETSQTFTLKALTNISEYPPLRLLIYKNYIKEIEDIPVRSEDINRYKETLLQVVTNVSSLGQVIYDVKLNDENNL